MIPNLDLITDLTIVFNLYEKCKLNRPVWNCLVNTAKSSLSHGPSSYIGRRHSMHNKTLVFSSPHPHSEVRESPGLKRILSFLLLITPLPHPRSYKNFSFCTTLRSAHPVARWDVAPFMSHLLRPITSSKLLS